jgi:hypothetical protein
MKTENKNTSAVEKEMNRFHNEKRFIEQKYKSQRNLIEKQKTADLERARLRHTSILTAVKNNT